MKQKEKGVINITPVAHRCIVGACPAVYQSESEILIVGRKISDLSLLHNLGIPVSENEQIVAIPCSLLENLVKEITENESDFTSRILRKER